MIIRIIAEITTYSGVIVSMPINNLRSHIKLNITPIRLGISSLTSCSLYSRWIPLSWNICSGLIQINNTFSVFAAFYLHSTTPQSAQNNNQIKSLQFLFEIKYKINIICIMFWFHFFQKAPFLVSV